jgi:hypothetical protein
MESLLNKALDNDAIDDDYADKPKDNYVSELLFRHGNLLI